MDCEGFPVEYIDDDQTLSQLCKEWAAKDYLAIDTEFMRTNTFYPLIGLLQVADEERCYLIDPLEITDWSGFKSLLTTSTCRFVIHSCSEDLNLLQTFLDVSPVKVFDTQIASAFLGIGFSVSYQGLARELLDIEVEKGETRSDWLKRPLSQSQLFYAASDVRYLLQIRGMLDEQLTHKGMDSWFEAECERQILVSQGAENEQAWKETYAAVSNAWRLDDQGLTILQKLTFWRERKARSRDKPKSWIVKDKDLFNMAQSLSAVGDFTVTDISSLAGVDERFLFRYGSELEKLLQDDNDQFRIDRSLLNPPLEGGDRKRLKAMQKVVDRRATELNMAPELLGRKKQLVELIKDYDVHRGFSWAGGKAGWRRELLESDFEEIMQA